MTAGQNGATFIDFARDLVAGLATRRRREGLGVVMAAAAIVGLLVVTSVHLRRVEHREARARSAIEGSLVVVGKNEELLQALAQSAQASATPTERDACKRSEGLLREHVLCLEMEKRRARGDFGGL